MFVRNILLTAVAAAVIAAPGASQFAGPPPAALNSAASQATSVADSGSGSAVISAQTREQRWLPPLGFNLDVSSPFRAPAHRYAAGHRGFDLAAVEGEAVASPVAGTVTFAGRVVDRPVLSVRVDDATLLSIEPLASNLKPGTAVARGERLGAVSAGGHCDGKCIHVGVRVDDSYVNPMRFFRDRPRLLPWE